jgi:hypothetical protein
VGVLRGHVRGLYVRTGVTHRQPGQWRRERVEEGKGVKAGSSGEGEEDEEDN